MSTSLLCPNTAERERERKKEERGRERKRWGRGRGERGRELLSSVSSYKGTNPVG